ncbi:hypothetical protein Ae201684P_014250 [Aphanomyces euteiches]|uniref:Uncharacterized protein n=1 Tax=Aphanomyces euteiches TaxID=100861 RepID=A0A6G0WR22_9STRA|nr:hypothetical protein Ae201684_012511 [Aphanomyces euteiches]KAH9090448.1 hypothetical protein Ae201684P_014250 [Aphanomyces euteiches]KAH9142241.1 hypothetical protein AeRB84_013674 [Aphanomyces euteiches]
MISAGANSGRQVGRSLSVVRVAGMNSAAWKIYEEWASSLGEQDSLVEVDFAPPDELRHTLLCPPEGPIEGMMNEANSLLHHLAPAMIQDFLQGVPAFIANLAPINIPLQPAAIRHGKVAVCAVPGHFQSWPQLPNQSQLAPRCLHLRRCVHMATQYRDH